MPAASNAAAAPSTPTPHQLPGTTILMGPFRVVALDLGNASSPLIDLPAQDIRTPDIPARLVLHQLVLSGLGVAPLAQSASTSSRSGAVVSALPLWAIGKQAYAATKEAQVYLSKCTVLLPLSDYTMLLSAALRGAAWKTNVSATAALLAGISVFEVSPVSLMDLTPSSPNFTLASYSGWGVNATTLTFSPSEPLEPCTHLPDWDGPLGLHCPSTSDSEDQPGGGTSRTVRLRIGLGVGLGVGCSLVLLAAGAVAAVVIRSQAEAAERQDALPRSLRDFLHRRMQSMEETPTGNGMPSSSCHPPPQPQFPCKHVNNLVSAACLVYCIADHFCSSGR